MSKVIRVVAFVGIMGAIATAECHAQTSFPAYNSYTNAIFRRPTVSPYLSLLQPNLGNGLPNYQNFVLPQIQQRHVNQGQSTAIRQLQSQAARQQLDTSRGNRGIRGTGHITTFMNHSHFFPGMASLPQRR